MTFGTASPEKNNINRQTDQTSGCLSIFWLPPLVVLVFGLMLTLATLKYGKPAVGSQFLSNGSSEKLAPLFTPEIQYWSENIINWANEYGIDPNIAATVMQIESCGNPNALSKAGASGLFQVMPFHFLDGENAFNPNTNALRGLNYLAKSLEYAGGDARLALAGYNGGISIISQPEANWANETIRYAYWGEGIYYDAKNNARTSARLDEWLSSGGASLCSIARLALGISMR